MAVPDSPVLMALKEVMKLPKEQRLAALVDRLDHIDQTELERGEKYVNGMVRLKVTMVAHDWLVSEAGNEEAKNKFAALRKFDKAAKAAKAAA